MSSRHRAEAAPPDRDSIGAIPSLLRGPRIGRGP